MHVDCSSSLPALNRPQISSIDVDGLKELPLLSCLDLSNNNIQQVPPQLGLVDTLRSVLTSPIHAKGMICAHGVVWQIVTHKELEFTCTVVVWLYMRASLKCYECSICAVCIIIHPQQVSQLVLSIVHPQRTCYAGLQ